MTTILEDTIQYLRRQQLSALITVIKGRYIGNKLLLTPDRHTKGSLGDEIIDQKGYLFAVDCLLRMQPGRTSIDLGGEQVEIFVDVFAPLPRLIIIGGVHIAIPLIKIAKAINFYTVMVDARPAFANRERFPDVDELIVEWPSDALTKLSVNESTCIVTLTHDDKFDVPSLAFAVNSPVRYIGALGSKQTHANRVEKLKELGVTEQQIKRIHAPVGLNIGAQNPEQIALSIIAEIVAVSHGVEYQ